MLQYISTLQEILKSLRAICGVDATAGDVGSKKELGLDRKEGTRKAESISNDEEWSYVQGSLQILTIADCLTSRSTVFEASLRATLARLSTTCLNQYIVHVLTKTSHIWLMMMMIKVGTYHQLEGPPWMWQP